MRQHSTDIVSLVFGLLFLGVSATWPLLHYDVIRLEHLQVVLPVMLVSIGLAGVLASLGRLRRDGTR